MRRFISRLTRRAKFAVGALLTIGAIGVSMVGFAAPGPDRPTKVWTPQENGFDYVTFNSYTNVGNGIGDERNFFQGVQVGRDGSWLDPVNNVQQNADVEAKIYIHNDADPLLNTVPDGNGGFKGVARNTTVRVALPTGTAKVQDTTAYISADNAQPQQIFDTLTLNGENGGFFSLAYEPGSGQLHNADGTTTNLTAAQEAQLIGGGLNLGDQNGCFQYRREITFRLKVNMPDYTVDKEVTTPGSTNWTENLDSKPGDTVSWLVTFKNVGQTELRSVKIVDEVPVGLTVVPGTVKLVNGNYPNGYVYPDSAIQANGRQVNVDIGNYNPGILGYVTYRTTVDQPSSTTCGTVSLVNKAFATPEGYGAVYDTATTTVDTNQVCAQASYSCQVLDVTKTTGRTVSVKVTPNATAGITVESYTYDFGDGAKLTTNQNPVTHNYASDGTYKVSASINFMVNGQVQSGVTSPACSQVVTFAATTTTPTRLADTGPGDVVGIFAAITVAGALLHRYLLGRSMS